MNEPKICPNCGEQTKEIYSIFLSKSGFPDSVERSLLDLYEKQGFEHRHRVCNRCINKKTRNLELAWIEIRGVLWGWINNGNRLLWRISKYDTEKVQFT